jgi:transcriptional regulator with XRE-family HTH domain
VFDDAIAYPIVFGKVVSNLREKRKPPMKQAELARLAQLKQGTLSRIEAGLLRADVLTARRIAISLGLTYEDLAARVEHTLKQTGRYAEQTMPRAAADEIATAIVLVGAFALVALAIDAIAAPDSSKRRRRS